MGVINHTSHPHVSHKEGKVYNIGQKLDLWNGPHYIIAEMLTTTANKSDHGESDEIISSPPISQAQSQSQSQSPWSTAKIVATIPSRWLLNICYMHSFCITDNYFILVEQPLSIFFPEIPFNHICRPKTLASCLQYFPEENTIFHVIPRNAHQNSEYQRKTFESRGFFFLHTINAYENGKEVVVDICCYDDPKMIDCMYVDALENAHLNPDYAKLFRGRPTRFHLNIDDDENVEGNSSSSIQPMKTLVKGKLIVDFGCETPRINYDHYDGKDYKYFYAISSDVDLDHPGWLVKVNVKERSYKLWGEPELNSYPSEPIFVPTPGSSDEDDGLVLSTLVYGGECVLGPNKVSVVILNAAKWVLIAKIDFQPGTCIPKCLHGWFFPEKDQVVKGGSATGENIL